MIVEYTNLLTKFVSYKYENKNVAKKAMKMIYDFKNGILIPENRIAKTAKKNKSRIVMLKSFF